MTISYLQKKQEYEDKGVMFHEDIAQDYYNITMIIHASMDLNNTEIFCVVVGQDYLSTMSEEVHLIIFNTLRKFVAWVSVTNVKISNHWLHVKSLTISVEQKLFCT